MGGKADGGHVAEGVHHAARRRWGCVAVYGARAAGRPRAAHRHATDRGRGRPEAEVETTRIHRAPYATVTSGTTFALNEPQAVFGRWQRQIAALRAAA